MFEEPTQRRSKIVMLFLQTAQPIRSSGASEFPFGILCQKKREVACSSFILTTRF